jgi:carbamoyltransferase
VDGTLVAVCEEERLSRVKHDGGFPAHAIDFCLQQAGLEAGDVTHVGLGWHPHTATANRLRFLLDVRHSRHLRVKASWLRTVRGQALWLRTQSLERFPNASFTFVEHHLAHAASAFYCSQFEEAAILSLDARGEWSTGLTGTGRGTTMAATSRAYYPESLGLLYDALTQYLGFAPFDEYKVMGLSSYGEPEYLDVFRQMFRSDPDSIFRVDRGWVQHPGYAPIAWGKTYYSPKVVETLGPARDPREPVERRHENVAKSLQARIEEVGVEIASHLRETSGQQNLVIAGGLGLNGLMNYAIKSRSGYDDMFVQPAANDGGISLGAALYIQHHLLGHPRSNVFPHAYWGPDLAQAEVAREIEICGLPSVRVEEPALAAAELLAQNKIIGWCQGRTEFGPRALGNRSILADPRDPANKDRVNARIKFREEFRPFAPSVLAEHAAEYFEGIDESPYMLMICPVRQDARDRIPAVVHVDGTARPQTVTAAANPLYHELIEHFERLTGVPVVLNTSFNVKGEPIVNTPQEAIRCFYSTGLDYLIVGSHVVYKTEPPRLEEAGSGTYQRLAT